MIYQLNKLVNIAFISKCVVCEHLMKQMLLVKPTIL